MPLDQSRTVVASLSSGEVVGEIPAEPPYDTPGALAFSPAGDRLAVGGMGVVSVYGSSPGSILLVQVYRGDVVVLRAGGT